MSIGLRFQLFLYVTLLSLVILFSVLMIQISDFVRNNTRFISNKTYVKLKVFLY
jgi:hypothetical protein